MLTQWINMSKEAELTYRAMGFIVLMSLLATFSEIFGFGIFLPIFQYIKMEGDVSALVNESEVWGYIASTLGFMNIDISLQVLLFIAFIFFSSRQIFTYIRVIYKAAIYHKLVQKLRNKIFDNYLSADIEFHDSVPDGNISNTIIVETSSAVRGLMQPLELVTYLIMALGYLSILLLLSWQITTISIIILLFSSRIPNVWIKQSAQIGRDLTQANTSLSAFLITRLKSPRLVRLSGTQTAENKEFNKLTRKQREKSVHSAILMAKTDVVIEPIIISLSLIFLYISHVHFNMQIEMIGLYLVIALRMMPVSKDIISQWQAIQSLKGPIEMVENRLDAIRKSEEIDNGTIQFTQIKKSIKFLHVSYCYPLSSVNALEDITIEMPVNSVTALVGPSGSGKSTLIDLLPRLRATTNGTIRIDSTSIGDYSLKSLRQEIAYATQDPQMFDGTIMDHIRYGKPDATKKEVVEAAKLAGADVFIKDLPNKYDTYLGKDAVKISGGQKQRIDLARTIISKPKIMILDEPTSSLDAESENIFRLSIKKIRRETNIAIIIIAHRLASISDSDQIIVLNQGRVESVGKHSDLIRKEGWYSRAWGLQNK